MTQTGKRRLKAGAFPTLFSHKRALSQTEGAKRRRTKDEQKASSCNPTAEPALPTPEPSCLDTPDVAHASTSLSKYTCRTFAI